MATGTLTTSTYRTPLIALLIAGAVSQVGSALTLVAVPWFVFQTTGSAAKTGLTGAAATLPFVIAGIFGGAFVDRLGFRRASVAGDITSGIAIMLVPLLAATGSLAYWQLLVLLFLGTLCNAPGATARRGMLPELAAHAGVSLERANSFAEAIPRLASLLGPPIAGLIIAVLGSTTALWFDAATFAFSALAIALFVPRHLTHHAPAAATATTATTATAEMAEMTEATAPAATTATTATTAQGRYWADLREGWQFIRREPLLRVLSIHSAIMNFFDAPFSLLLTLLVTATTGRVQDLGFYVATFGAGALMASLAYGVIGTRLPRRVPLVLWMGGFALVNGILALTPPRAVVLAALLVMGLAAGLVNPTMSTVTQQRVPAALRGRVFGLLTATSFAAIPLGRGIAGVLAGSIGLSWVYAGIAVAYVISFVATLTLPAYRLLDTRTPQRGGELLARAGD